MPPHPARWGRRIVLAAVLLAGAAGALGASTALARHRASAAPQVVPYLAAWERGDAAAMAAVVNAPPPDFAAQVQSFKSAVHPTQSKFALVRIRSAAGATFADYHARLELPGYGPWEYDGVLPLVRVAGHWRIKFSPSALHPGLEPGTHIVVHQTWSDRAPILDAAGQPLVTLQPARSVILHPTGVTDLNRVKDVLFRLLQVSPAAVDQAMHRHIVGKDDLVPVINTPDDAHFQTIKRELLDVPGIRLDPKQLTVRVAAAGISGQILGSVGEATAERLTQLGGPYRAGDKVGMSGLEKAFETRLAGTPKGDIDVVAVGGATVRTLQEFIGTPPLPVRTTLDPNVQRAAEAALPGGSAKAALVAIDATTGDVRAAVSHPGNDFERALVGQYPPGSTFKVVTATALLAHGANADTPAQCPAQITVGGTPIHNVEGEQVGPMPLHTAFAKSCNTAFVGLASGLPPHALGDAAAQFGFGIEPHLGLGAAGGTVPEPKDEADAAAEAIGQGRVTASPLQMAVVAGTADSGSWHAPRLIIDPAPTASAPGTASVQPAPPALDPQVAEVLRSMMAEVVASGTGTAAATSGATVSGKTGTAEFGPGPVPHTHAWFIGFRNKLAFSVIVEDGGRGGIVAAPIASRFLTTLPAG